MSLRSAQALLLLGVGEDFAVRQGFPEHSLLIEWDWVVLQVQLGQVGQPRQRREVGDLVVLEAQRGQVSQPSQRREVGDLVYPDIQLSEFGQLRQRCDVGDSAFPKKQRGVAAVLRPSNLV